MKKRGFTLIELMVVMAIIAVLAVLILGAIQAARRTQIETANRSNAKTLQTSLEAYYARNKVYCGVGTVTCATGTFEAKAAQLGGAGFTTNLSDSSSTGRGGDVTALSSAGYTLSIDDYNGAVPSPAETITVP